ncbi:hypothetical protein FS749_002882 [Ceratobasidium sp. UAMH 11750]|nr:hypothetical protein FS749_002882 [Ceratobasidium sp. UAMH 11750]
MKEASKKLKIFAPITRKTADHCTMCDDGGKLILCSLCHAPYCYDELGGPEAGPEADDEQQAANLACVTLPKGFADDESRVFRCPACLAYFPEREIDYSINRGSRATQRMSATNDVVVIITYLPSLRERIQVMWAAARSLLGVFELNVIVMEVELGFQLCDADMDDITNSESPFHLLFLFATESDPRGGWWFLDGGQAGEKEWLQKTVVVYESIASKALSARIFGVSCGVNLTAPGTVDEILAGLEGTSWTSMVLPAAASVQCEDYCWIFPEVFLQLYYNSRPLKTSLLGVWSKGKQVREHTNLIVVEQPGNKEKRTIHKYCYAPENSRPLGLKLPLARAYCLCMPNDSDIKWERLGRHRSLMGTRPLRFDEVFAVMRSSCKHTLLYIAVFNHGFDVISIGGTTIVRQAYDSDLGCFPLDMHGRFRLQIASTDDGQKRPFEHNCPWTRAGVLKWSSQGNNASS